MHFVLVTVGPLGRLGTQPTAERANGKLGGKVTTLSTSQVLGEFSTWDISDSPPSFQDFNIYWPFKYMFLSEA